MVRWQDIVLKKCWEIIDSGGGEIRIQFSYRKPNQIAPIVRAYPNNQIICDIFTIEED